MRFLTGERAVMPKGSASIIIDHSFEAQLSAIIKRRIGSRINAMRGIIKDEIKNIIVNNIKSTDVWRGLEGRYTGIPGMDLQAEFGITSIAGLEQLIKGLIDVSVVGLGKAGTTIDMEIQILDIDVETLVSMYNDSSYISKGGYKIDWLEWLLIRNYDFSISDYAIDYDIDSTQISMSRTGRALMIKDKPELHYPYKLPDICRPIGGKNFIDASMNHPKNIEKLQQSITNIIEKAIA
jgi:hypothetical protein